MFQALRGKSNAEQRATVIAHKDLIFQGERDIKSVKSALQQERRDYSHPDTIARAVEVEHDLEAYRSARNTAFRVLDNKKSVSNKKLEVDMALIRSLSAKYADEPPAAAGAASSSHQPAEAGMDDLVARLEALRRM